MKPLRPGAEQLTVEAACHHRERLQVCEGAPFRRDATSEPVGVVVAFAKVEHLE